jgi:hypothetical protein
MKVIVVTDDELQRLEKRFGPSVRQMGPWNSDGTFGYSSVPIAAVEKAAEALADPNLLEALSRVDLKQSTRTKPFIDLLEAFGPALIERIVAAYRGCPFELAAGPHLSPKPPKQETRRVSIAMAG